MSATAPAADATSVLAVLDEMFAGSEPLDFAVRLWDGTRWTPDGAGEPAFTLVVETPAALRRLLRPGSEAALAEAYLAGELSVEGDIFAVPDLRRVLLERDRGLTDRIRLAFLLLKLPRGTGHRTGDGDEPAGAAHGGEADATSGPELPEPELRGALHSIERDRAAVTHHYDLSNRFYSFFLDRRMVYSGAVFRHASEPLEAAQERKLDLICRKLRLEPGDRLLDIGCGWGALVMYAAAEYGAEARGVTLSERQASLARDRIRDAGLEDRCSVEVRDYRELGDDAFDSIASVGMFEHVGRARAPDYFATIHRLLRPGGSYLHHAITANPTVEGHGGPTLSDRYVFPDHELIPIGETLSFAEEAGFDVRDVEGLREHYALTLRRWVAALEEHHAEAVAEVGEATWRAWRLIFAGAAVDFEAGRQGLAQTLLVKKEADGAAGVPLGRWDWYEDGA
ncbi:MAG: cyclopropane-fatty-acyl-phospholipid synthase family protein [Longimicrobiales bacterium]